MLKIMLTGHREVPKPALLKAQLKELLNKLKEHTNGELLVISGGASGADTIWVSAAQEIKVLYDIYVPVGYENIFLHGPQQEMFEALCESAHKVIRIVGNDHIKPLAGGYRKGANLERNQRMVDEADYCIVVSRFDPRHLAPAIGGGTAHCTRYIQQMNKPYWWINAELPLQYERIAWHNDTKVTNTV